MVTFPLSFSFVVSLVRTFYFLGQAWAEGEGELAMCRGLRTGKPGKMYAAMIYIGRMRV